MPLRTAHADNPDAYFEIVREKPSCKTDGCFIEYMVLKNGLMVKKQVDAAAEDAAGKIAIRRADTKDLIGQTNAFIGGRNFSPMREAEPESIFFYDGDKYYAWESKDPDAPGFYALFQQVEAAFDKAPAADDFYLHAYYTPVKGNTKDFHVFPDGTVIASMFGKDTYLIVYTFMSHTGAAELEKLRALGARAVNSKSADYKKCTAALGIDFGFLEMKLDGGYIRSYTCPGEADGVAPLMDHVRTTFGGMRP